MLCCANLRLLLNTLLKVGTTQEMGRMKVASSEVKKLMWFGG